MRTLATVDTKDYGQVLLVWVVDQGLETYVVVKVDAFGFIQEQRRFMSEAIARKYVADYVRKATAPVEPLWGSEV